MFSRTEIAKQFRKWGLDILDNETQKTTPADFDVRHLPIITNECKRINAIYNVKSGKIFINVRLNAKQII